MKKLIAGLIIAVVMVGCAYTTDTKYGKFKITLTQAEILELADKVGARDLKKTNEYTLRSGKVIVLEED